MTGRARGVVIVPVLLAVAGVIAGARLLAPRGGAAEQRPSYLSYKVPAGQALAFPVAPEERDLAVTVQVDAAEAIAAGHAARFAVTTRVTDPARAGEVWRSRTVLEAPVGAEITEGGEAVTAPHTLRLDVPPVGPGAQLAVTVESDGGRGPRFAVLRVVHRESRGAFSADSRAARAQLIGGRASVFGWSYLDEEAQAVLLEEPLIRRSAADKKGDHADLVHVRIIPRPRRVAPVVEPGEIVDTLHGVAYTVRGPGKVRIELAALGDGPAAATVRTVDSRARVTQFPVHISPQGSDVVFVPPEDGALTVEVLAGGAPLRARAWAGSGARRLGDPVTTMVAALRGGVPASTAPGAVAAPAEPAAQVVEPASKPDESERELAPDRRRAVLWRIHPAGPPLVATLAGDGVARVAVRPVANSQTLALGAARLRWRLVARDGAVVNGGVLPVALVPTPFDRIRPTEDGRVPAPTSEPVSFAAAGPVDARLELSAVGAPLDVQLLAVDDVAEARLDAAYEIPLAEARLRHAPYLRRKQAPFLPDNHVVLALSAGRVILEGQVRLEPTTRRQLPVGPFVAIEPERPRTRQLLMERDDDAARDLARWGFATNDEAKLTVAARGPDAGRLLLDTHFGPEALGGALQVFVDGAPVEERIINVTRGRVRLRELAPGVHDVTVKGPRGRVFTSARGAGRGATYVERIVWRMGRGAPLTVEVPTTFGEAANLNVVLYSDEPVASRAELVAQVEIDGGARAAGLRAARGRTRLIREVRVPLEATSSMWQDREGGAAARGRFGVLLGEDVGGGAHRIRVAVLDGPSRVHARFFRTGKAAKPAASFAETEWSAD